MDALINVVLPVFGIILTGSRFWRTNVTSRSPPLSGGLSKIRSGVLIRRRARVLRLSHGRLWRFEFANVLREGGDAPALEVLGRGLDGLVVGCVEEEAEDFV
jgi:hypothetical protein